MTDLLKYYCLTSVNALTCPLTFRVLVKEHNYFLFNLLKLCFLLHSPVQVQVYQICTQHEYCLRFLFSPSVLTLDPHRELQRNYLILLHKGLNLFMFLDNLFIFLRFNKTSLHLLHIISYELY